MNINAKTRMHISLFSDQAEAIEKLARLASTTKSDVLRQIVQRQREEVLAAIETWEKHGHIMRPKRKGRMGFTAL